MADHGSYAWRKAAREFKAGCYASGSPVICYLCGTEIPRNAPRNSPQEFCADHEIPMELRDDLSDTTGLMPTHRKCNTRKGLGPARRMSPPSALVATVLPARPAPTPAVPRQRVLLLPSSLICVTTNGTDPHARTARCRTTPGHVTTSQCLHAQRAEQQRDGLTT